MSKDLISQELFLRYLNSRKPIKASLDGELVDLTIANDGNYLPAGHKYTGSDGSEVTTPFAKVIYNVRANNSMLQDTPEFRKLFSSAQKAEAAGDMETASELFNEYLNGVQMSVSVRADAPQFAKGQVVTCTVATVQAKNGTAALVLNAPAAKKSVKVEAVKYTAVDLGE